MARSTANKLYKNFVGGLITEASPLTYPENASLSEDNCLLFRKGNRTRRLGLDYEEGYVVSNHSMTEDQADLDGFALKEFTWFNAGEDSSVNFLCTQVGARIYFYDLSLSAASSANQKSFFISLSDYKTSSYDFVWDEDVSFATGRGFLFIAGRKIEPIIVEYDKASDDLVVSQINILIRDFDGLDDGLANDAEPTFLTATHNYNLKNQGWIDPQYTGSGSTDVEVFSFFNIRLTYNNPTSTVINQYKDKTGRYPGNNKQWWVGKLDADNDEKGLKAGDFDPDLLKKSFFGNTRAPRGHYIVNAFDKDRTGVSGVPNLPRETKADRPEALTFYAGRAWYGAGSDIYFSQTLAHKRQAGFCYQEADPTAEFISDLLDNDGGTIPIPEARRIRRLLATGNGIVVFAENGVWYISGTSAGFTATDYSVSKISSFGIESPNSIVEAEDKVFWWSQTGIMALTQQAGLFGPISGSFDQQNISEQTVQTYFNSTIPSSSKPYVKGYYDPASNIIQWLWASSSVNRNYMYDRILNYDLSLGAFYPWSISKDPEANGPYINGAFLTPTVNQIDGSEDVYNNDFVDIIQDGGDTVTTNAPNLTIRNRSLKFVFSYPVSLAGTPSYKFTHGLFDSTTYGDWAEYSTADGYPYTSYVETGYELFEDALRNKQIDYIAIYFRRTEENFVADGSGSYTVDLPSSCKFRTKWDWSDTTTANRWSTEVEAYRHQRVPFVDVSDLSFDTGFPVVVSKNKVRGRGRAIQLRFSNDQLNSNFDLLGWAMAVSGNTMP